MVGITCLAVTDRLRGWIFDGHDTIYDLPSECSNSEFCRSHRKNSYSVGGSIGTNAMLLPAVFRRSPFHMEDVCVCLPSKLFVSCFTLFPAASTSCLRRHNFGQKRCHLFPRLIYRYCWRGTHDIVTRPFPLSVSSHMQYRAACKDHGAWFDIVSFICAP